MQLQQLVSALRTATNARVTQMRQTDSVSTPKDARSSAHLIEERISFSESVVDGIDKIQE